MVGLGRTPAIATTMKKTTSKKKSSGPAPKKPDTYERTYLSKGLSIHPQLYEQILARANELGMKFSEYMSHVARQDLARGGAMTIPAKRKDGGDSW